MFEDGDRAVVYKSKYEWYHNKLESMMNGRQMHGDNIDILYVYTCTSVIGNDVNVLKVFYSVSGVGGAEVFFSKKSQLFSTLINELHRPYRNVQHRTSVGCYGNERVSPDSIH